MAGGFAGGLAQGIGQGVQLSNQMSLMDLYKQDRDRQAKADQRDAELHQVKMDEFNRARSANQEVADFLTPKQESKPAQTSSLGQLGDTGSSGLSNAGQQPSDTRAPGLSDLSKPAQQMPAGRAIAKNMLTGNLLNDPEKMTAVANIYAKHGMLDKMLPWMNQAYQAKKSGIVDALPYLMAGDGENAAAMLKRGGMNIQGTPTLVDKQNHVWSFNIGGQPREIGMRQLIGMADPENWLKAQQDQQKNEADVDLKKAQAEYYRGAKTQLASAQAGRAGRLGQSGGLSNAPKVQRTMETENGIVAVMSDGTHKAILDGNGNPVFGTTNLKVSSNLVGKTLNQYGDNGDIAGNVKNLSGQLRGGLGIGPQKNRIDELPNGAKQIGTSNGKPVYEVNGRRFIAE